MKLLSNDYTNPNTNPRTLTTLTLTLTDPHDAFESFCSPVFCTLYRITSGSELEPLVLIHASLRTVLNVLVTTHHNISHIFENKGVFDWALGPIKVNFAAVLAAIPAVYIAELAELSASLGLSSHFHADDTQLYTWGLHRQLHISGIEWN